MMPELADTMSWSIVSTIFGEASADPKARLHDAELLLVYCARNGIEISPNSLSAVLSARREIDAGPITPATESALWAALNDLSKAAAPVTVFSLKVNTKFWKTVYGVLFIIVLVAVLWLQFFWFIGTTLTNDLSTLQKQAQLAATALTQPATNASDTAGGAKGNTETGQNQQNNNPSDMGSPGSPLDNYLNLQAAIIAKERLLSVWVSKASWLSPLSEPPSKANPGAPVATDQMVANNNVQAHAPLLLGGLRLYALPLLYGLLGAFVYVLRRIARDGELYTGEGDWIRICFGSAAGIGMGLFFGQDAPQLQVLGTIQSTASSLSPFALAFAGGYSADILFAALDKLVSAFSGVGATKESPASAGAEATPNNGRQVTRIGNGTGSVVSGDGAATPVNGATGKTPETGATKDKPDAPVTPAA